MICVLILCLIFPKNVKQLNWKLVLCHTREIGIGKYSSEVNLSCRDTQGTVQICKLALH